MSCSLSLRIFSSHRLLLNPSRMLSTPAILLSQHASVGVDIGLPPPHRQRRDIRRGRAALLRDIKGQEEMETRARHRTLRIPLDKVKEVWEKSSGPYQIRAVAHHYGIFKDLFDGAEFVPYVPLKITYPSALSESSPVHRGNIISPSESAESPNVEFDSENNCLWTLLLTNPDGHLLDNEAEYVHWLIANIPGSGVSEGDLLVDYLPPFPARGTGYHRLIFILFKQDGRVAFENEKCLLPCRRLADRTFSTLEFYRAHQDVITPAGLAFFQSRWDPSVQQTFHKALRMKEPVFDYDYPKPYIAPQLKWPHKKPVGYLDKFLPKE